jgi:hypothetical protein
MWLRIAFADAITHACPGELAPDLIVDMAHRGCPIENYEEKYGTKSAAELGGNPKVITKWSFDCGGAWYVGEPVESLILDGLLLKVPSSQFKYVLSDVRRSQVRRFDDGAPYHKLKFWMHATVLTPNQHASIVSWMEGKASDAAARYAEFDTERNRKREEASRPS